METSHPQGLFRLDNETLAFRYTATVSHRDGHALERLDEPIKLRQWLVVNDLDPGATPTPTELAQARELREAIYRLGAALAHDQQPALPDLDLLNSASAAGAPIPLLDANGMHWSLDSANRLGAALAVIARDAIHVLGTSTRGRIKTCEGSECAGLFLDTSRAAARRWCSMNTCGNKNKKNRMRANN
ncbi:ABATE domain-containing protein [Microbacterium sp. X-17]|uniref:CGNR zinc finger domain-containing protein n=1 Tax=Microbacterium sp. X-17 TaxID=3144404 RepID=UPI0031F5B116